MKRTRVANGAPYMRMEKKAEMSPSSEVFSSGSPVFEYQYTAPRKISPYEILLPISAWRQENERVKRGKLKIFRFRKVKEQKRKKKFFLKHKSE